MIYNLKDMALNNYVTWVYSTLLQRVQAAETDISINGGDISRIYDFVGYDGQLMYSLNLAPEQIPEGSDLNDYISAGAYYCTGTNIATTMTNVPTTLNFKLVVEFLTSAFIGQTVIARDGKRWYRTYTISAKTWSDWVCGTLHNISNITMDDNGQLVVTRADGIKATFAPNALI